MKYQDHGSLILNFKAINILSNVDLNANEMNKNELYLFKIKGVKVAAWLDNKGQVKVKKVDRG